MSIYRRIVFISGLLLSFGAPLACSSDPPVSTERSGTMSMPLQATAPSGNVYQLRSASFSVFATGATVPTTTLTTSAFNEPSATLTAPLAVGSYTIQLQTPGWQVLRVDPSTGAGVAVAATLTSANPASFSITSNQTTNVGFAFDVPGDGSIGFGGNLAVSINVNEVDGGTPPDGGSGGTFVLTTGVTGPGGVGIPGTVTGPGINCNGSATADCTETLASGTSVQLTAAPAGTLVFSGWSGAGCTDPMGQPLTTPTITVAMTQARTCIANFAQQQQFTLTVQLQSTGGAAVGSVSGPGITCDASATADCSQTFAPGTSVALTPSAAGTSSFTGWSGMTCVDAMGQTGPVRTLLMNQNVTCIASFGPTMATFPPAGMTIVGWYSAETQFLTATAMGTVAEWSDRSGLGNHLTDATGSGRPVFDPTGWSAGSGQGAVLFQGAQSIATGAALGSLFNGTGVAFSVLAVIRAASDTDGAIATFEQSGTGVSFHRMRVSNGGPFLRYQALSDTGAAATNDENAVLSLTTGNVVAWTNTGTSSILRTDGNAVDTGAIALGAINTNLFRVGAAITGPSLFLNGRIAELIVVNGAISATQYTDFRNYARSRWAGLP